MEFSDKVSIIIPVFNAEKYLRECLDSILNQTYKNIELILVNDGSMDKSAFICNEFARVDERVKVIHQENSGPSAARNEGIKVAQGRFIQFVDSDDFIEPDMTLNLVKEMGDNIQLVLCGYNSIFVKGSTQKIIPNIEGVYHYHEFLEIFGLLYRDNLINSPCNKLYYTEIIKNSDVYFDKDLNMGEDLIFNLKYFRSCHNIKITNKPLYNYLIYNNINSLTGSFKENLFENQRYLYRKVREFLVNDKRFEGENKDLVIEKYTDNIIDCFGNLFHKDNPYNSKNIKQRIKNIVLDESVLETIINFKKGNIQKRLFGSLIEMRLPTLIYYFFLLKNFMQYNMSPLFIILKKFNRK